MLSREWKTSSYSANQDCVEVRLSPQDTVQVRDSKDPDGGTLEFGRAQWAAFVADIKAGAGED